MYKVFLFDDQTWLYCEGVKHKDNIWSGWVINGNWFLHFDEKTAVLKVCNSASIKNPVTESVGRKLTWACDPYKTLFDYTDVIEDAKKRYEAGDEANYVLTEPKRKEKEFDDEVAF